MNSNNIDFDPDERLALAQWYIDQNRLDNALAEIKGLLDDKANSQITLTAARLYAQLRLFERAQKLFQQYLEQNPNSTNARFQLGMSQFDNGEAEQALDTWQHLLEAKPENPPALFYSALARLQRGESGEAESMLHTILHHTHRDNLFYGKASDLLDQIRLEPNRIQAANESLAEVDNKAGKNHYETEH